MRIDIEDINKITHIRKLYNQIPLEKIIFYKNEKPMEIDSRIIEEFKFTGLNNIDFITTGYYLRKYGENESSEEIDTGLEELKIQHISFPTTGLILELNEYQAKNLLALLQLIGTGLIMEKSEQYNSNVISANNGDWIGEIRWQLEDYIKEDGQTNFGKELPDWAAQRGQWITKKQWKEKYG